MRPIPWAPVALAALVAVAAAASAQQSQGSVETTVEPEQLVVDYQLHIPQGGQEPPRQTFTVHVTGEIQCAPGTQPPRDVGIRLNGTPRATVSDGRGAAEYYAIGQQQFAVPWAAVSGQAGLYRVDAEEVITVYSNATNPASADQTFTLQWDGGWLEPQGTTRCNPSGYGWTVDAGTNTIVLPAIQGDPDPFPEPGADDRGTPTPALAPLAALGVALLLRRFR